ncbi:Nose resistant-to-fluoxetine protein, N-terminal,Acyltransferase 3 [Cinara cedri]|uniref:Nose resistant-to-fluoxetine protein, N-terminal,Acyltransferase 3 n=1 Tax=Cinara cedri TaxID=506608 RepID=A0A5E4NAT0_9HEMI|nr:Nose resistant-to-fluoxetine protein, N-terminal,Acyltransferase 3 [Cinara cedri]
MHFSTRLTFFIYLSVLSTCTAFSDEPANSGRGGHQRNVSRYIPGDFERSSPDPTANSKDFSNINSNFHHNSSVSMIINSTDNHHRFPKTWVANLFYDALVNFTVMKTVGSSACQKQTQMYIRHLANDSLWAVQMSDSWSRYPNGILVGTTHQMGVYEECVEVHRPVRGKYCIPDVHLGTATGEDFGKPDGELPGNDHAWREILGFVDNDNRIHRDNVKFGICIPDSCTAADLEISLQKQFDKHFLPHRVKALVRVQSILCSTDKDEYPYDAGFYLTSSLVGSIFLFCCLSTAYHLIVIVRSNNNRGEKSYKMPEILNSFSIIRNGRDLIKYDKNNELNIFNGLKVITMVLVLFGHKFLYLIINPIMYGKMLERVYTVGPDFLLTCLNLVDPFFYITGYLVYVLLIRQFTKPATNWHQIPTVIAYKYLRILPSYVAVMLLTAFVIPHLGDGPFWASRIWPEAENCKNYWWANLLAVSNFIKVKNQCLIAGWYISCLLQLLVIGIVVVYVRAKNPRVGICVMVLLLCSSLITPFVMTYIYQVYGIIRIMLSFLESPDNSFEFSNMYRPFYLRGTPYYAGLLAGVTVEELKKRAVKFSPRIVYAGTIIISAICVWVQLYGAVFYDVNRPYSVLEQSLYATLSHCTWTVILFWVTLCHFTSGYGPIEKLFNNRLMVPLGRLSYAVYLVNITVMMMIESRQRAAVYPSKEFLINGWIFGAVRTYLIGGLLYLIVEAPSGLLIKTLLNEKFSGYAVRRKYSETNDRASSSAAAAEAKPRDVNGGVKIAEQKDSTRL